MARRFPATNLGGKQEQERFRVENYPEQKPSVIDPCPWLWAQHPQLTITVGPRYYDTHNDKKQVSEPIVPTKREERHG